MSTTTRIAAAILFCALLAEAFLLSPAQRPDQGEWLMRLMTGDWAGEEPLVVALFNLMGVWPMALLALLSPWLRRRPIPLWPFGAGSFALGAFSLLPGLVLGGTPIPMAPWQRALGSRWVALFLLLPAVGLIAWGVALGSPAAFVSAWQHEQFVHIMALDFVVLWLTSVFVARDQGGPWQLTLLPLLGALAYRAKQPARAPAEDPAA